MPLPNTAYLPSNFGVSRSVRQMPASFQQLHHVETYQPLRGHRTVLPACKCTRYPTATCQNVSGPFFSANRYQSKANRARRLLSRRLQLLVVITGPDAIEVRNGTLPASRLHGSMKSNTIESITLACLVSPTMRIDRRYLRTIEGSKEYPTVVQ